MKSKKKRGMVLLVIALTCILIWGALGILSVMTVTIIDAIKDVIEAYPKFIPPDPTYIVD